MQRTLILVALAIVAVVAINPPPNEYRKKLQGPPSEFDDHLIPQPQLAALISESAWYDLMFTKAADGTFVWKGEVVVDSVEELDISLFSPFEDALDIIVQPPGELPFSLGLAQATHDLMAQRSFESVPYSVPYTKESGPYGIDGASYPVTTYTFEKPKIGTWNAQVIIKAADVPTDSPAAIAMITNRASLQLYSHLNKYELEVGQEIGLVANLFDQTTFVEGTKPAALSAASLKPTMIVNYPSGRKVEVPMHDDGVHADQLSNDGVFGGVVEALEAGQYIARAVFEGVTADGVRFVRSTEHSFQVVEPYITLTGLSSVEYQKEEKAFFFHIDVDVLTSDVTAVKAYAEVWGTDESGYEYAPVAWMEAMVDPQVDASGNDVIVLQLHEDWVHNAKVSAPFQLRNVWVQDRDWNVVMSERSHIFVYADSASLGSFKVDHSRKAALITEEMRVGPRPASMRNTSRIAAEGTLILVHGYCAGHNEFPRDQFTNAVQFQDYKQARSNDAFALKIREFGDQFPAFSIVAHSQGGLAATHLHAYYWSNLENAQGGRLIQSVGSPYYGSGLAGNLATIGKIFGLGCGKNNDLTYDGASKWAAALPAVAVNDVYYYTTQYTEAFLSRWCVFGSNLVLYRPNDGTTELPKAKLAGAHHAGHKEGWCHTNGMKYANQCSDVQRNKEMNAAAAR